MKKKKLKKINQKNKINNKNNNNFLYYEPFDPIAFGCGGCLAHLLILLCLFVSLWVSQSNDKTFIWLFITSLFIQFFVFLLIGSILKIIRKKIKSKS